MLLFCCSVGIRVPTIVNLLLETSQSMNKAFFILENTNIKRLVIKYKKNNYNVK